jgi:hypothetical protein
MEQVAVWAAIFAPICFTFLGWVFNSVITKKIDDIKAELQTTNDQVKEDRELFFRRLDEEKARVDAEFVRRDMYEQSMRHQRENNEAAVKSLLHIMNTQFANLESKMQGISDKIGEKVNDMKELEKKIDGLKDLINKKLTE